MNDQSTKGVLYCRYSSHAQRDVSIDQQIKECEKFAERNNIDIIKVYDDRAMSGTNDRRPMFQAMLAEAARLDYQYIIVYSLDRFARDRYDSAVYKRQLKSCGKKVLSATENISDDPSGVLMESLLEGLAEYYSKELSRKIRRGMDDNAERCMANGSLPYGYRRGKDGKYEIVSDQAAVVQEVFLRVSNGESMVSIYNSLNARGLRTKRGHIWNKNSFNRLLSNIRYTGVYVYRDKQIPGGIPAIIDKELFDAVQHHLHTKSNPRISGDMPTRRRRENSVYLLTGKLFCGKCKSPMVGISGKSGVPTPYYYYACKAHRQTKLCDMKAVRRDAIEREVAAAIKRYILVDDTISQLADYAVKAQNEMAKDTALDTLQEQLTATTASIGNIVSAIERGAFSEAMQLRLSELEAVKKSLEDEIAYSKLRRAPSFTRDDFVAMLHLYRDGDIDDKDYQEKLIDTFLIAAYVYSDHLHLVFDFGQNAKDHDIDIALVQNADRQADEQNLFKGCKAPPNEVRTNTYFFSGGFAVTCSL